MKDLTGHASWPKEMATPWKYDNNCSAEPVPENIDPYEKHEYGKESGNRKCKKRYEEIFHAGNIEFPPFSQQVHEQENKGDVK